MKIDPIKGQITSSSGLMIKGNKKSFSRSLFLLEQCLNTLESFNRSLEENGKRRRERENTDERKRCLQREEDGQKEGVEILEKSPLS